MPNTNVTINRDFMGYREGGFAIDDLSHWKPVNLKRRVDDPESEHIEVHFKSGGLMYIAISHTEFQKSIAGKPFTQK